MLKCLTFTESEHFTRITQTLTLFSVKQIKMLQSLSGFISGRITVTQALLLEQMFSLKTYPMKDGLLLVQSSSGFQVKI